MTRGWSAVCGSGVPVQGGCHPAAIRVPACAGEAAFWLRELQSRALALPRASPVAVGLQLRSCAAKHKVILTLGAKGCV